MIGRGFFGEKNHENFQKKVEKKCLKKWSKKWGQNSDKIFLKISLENFCHDESIIDEDVFFSSLKKK